MNVRSLPRAIEIVIALAMVAATGTAGAASGKLALMPIGNYLCSEPGDANGPAWISLPDKHFTIRNGSTYYTDAGSGTYLLAGDRTIFTRGPMEGMRFMRTGHAKLRAIDRDGNLGRVRCIRTTASR